MRAIFDGQDYLLLLGKKENELVKLLNTNLEAKLEMALKDEDLDKKVILGVGDNDDGIDLKYFPEEHKGWDDIKEIRVKVNQWAYKHILEYGTFETRYNGSDKIEIMNGEPKDFM